MPYLPLDLDARKRMPLVANYADISPESVLWGLTGLWEQAWLTKSDTVTTGQLRGHFPCTGEVVGAALREFQFLELLTDGTWRIKGAAKWLKLRIDRAENGRAGGKVTAAGGKSAKNLKQHAEAIASEAPKRQPSKAEATAEAKSEALTPNTQHPTPKETKTYTPPEGSGGFFARCMGAREAFGLHREKPPHPNKLGAFWSECMLELHGDEGAAYDAYEEFLHSGDAYWAKAKPPFPFAGFMSQWQKWVTDHPAEQEEKPPEWCMQCGDPPTRRVGGRCWLCEKCASAYEAGTLGTQAEAATA